MPSRWLKPTRSDHFCQRRWLPSSVNEAPSGWVISSGRTSSRSPQARHEVRHVLAHRVRLVDAVDVLDLQQLHPVEVDDEVQARDRVGVRAGALPAAAPDVGPADPPAAMLLGHEVRAVGPGVDQHQVHVGDPAPGERLDHARVPAQGRVALVELVDGHVRLAVGLVLPGDDAILAERDARLVDAAVVAVPADHDGLARDRGARLVRPDGLLGRLAQLDRGEAPALADAPVAAQDAAAARISSAPSGSSGCGATQSTSLERRSRYSSRRTARRASPSRAKITGGLRVPL